MPRSVPRADPDAGPGPPRAARPTRRAALGVVGVVGALATVAAGCSAPSTQAPTRDGPVRPGPSGSTSSSPDPEPQDDEEVRRALLSDVDALRAVVVLAGASQLVGAVATALDGRSRALTTRADARRPSASPASPVATDGSPAALVDALASASVAAASMLDRPLSGPAARLVAAVAAGHAVGADVLSRASALPVPQGLPAAGGPGEAERPGVPDIAPARSATTARALAAAREVEAQARYAYGVAAVHLEGDALAAALALRTAHDQTFSALDLALLDAPGSAPGPGPRDAWVLPSAVVDGTTAATLAATVEDGCTDAWADVVAASRGQDRAEAATATVASALRGARWRYRLGRGADLTPLPGLTGRT